MLQASRFMSKLAVVLCSCGWIFACSSVMAAGNNEQPGNVISPDFRAPQAGELIVLLPPQQVIAGIEKGEEFLFQQLKAQLKAAGYKVVSLNAENYADAWVEEREKMGGIFDPVTGQPRADINELILTRVAARVIEGTHCAMVISPALVRRMATYANGKSRADWDGQSRPQRYVGDVGAFKFSGTTGALSINLVAYDRDAKAVFDVYGGTSLLYVVNVADAVTEVRADLFANDKETADGVRIALQPLLGNELRK